MGRELHSRKEPVPDRETGRASRRSTRGGRRRARAGGKKFPGGLAALARGPERQRGRARPNSPPWRSVHPTARPPARLCALGEGGLVVGSQWSPRGLSCSSSGLGTPRDEIRVPAGTSGRGFGPTSCSQVLPVSGLVSKPGSHHCPTISPPWDLPLKHF